MQKMETYYGQVRTPADAIKLFEACRLGMLPRVQRRLSEKERQAIRSGSVFVWDEREAGMRRWTDGKSWSASRVSGSFLTYREMEGKRGSGFGGGRRGAGKTPDSGRGSDEDHEDGEPEGYRYKADGLLKQSFSITTSNGQHLHLISYYSRPHSGQPELLQPTTDPNLRHITPQKGLYPESSLHDSNPTPALTRAPMAHHPAYTISQPPAQVPAYASYHPQYAQQSPGYTWPPSPVATPPYSQHQAPGYPPTTMPPHVAHTAPPPHHTMYHPAPPPQHPYERAPLPPPAAQSRALPPYPQAHSPHMSHSHSAGSPRGHHAHTLSAPFPPPQLPQLDPNLRRGSPPTSRGPLPTLMPIAPPQGSTSPARTHSVSPPRSSHSDANTAVSSNKTSISSLLHATPSNSEPSSANPASNTSAASSPRTMTRGGPLPPLPDRSGVFSEDVRTRELLDRKFCI